MLVSVRVTLTLLLLCLLTFPKKGPEATDPQAAISLLILNERVTHYTVAFLKCIIRSITGYLLSRSSSQIWTQVSVYLRFLGLFQELPLKDRLRCLQQKC